jgi:hypothetical protein
MLSTEKRKRRRKPQAVRRKRSLFTELMEGLIALREEREGKRTLRTTVVTIEDGKIIRRVITP